jgi:hypothetical protein
MHHIAELAQLVERTTLNRVVEGSIPSFGAISYSEVVITLDFESSIRRSNRRKRIFCYSQRDYTSSSAILATMVAENMDKRHEPRELLHAQVALCKLISNNASVNEGKKEIRLILELEINE